MALFQREPVKSSEHPVVTADRGGISPGTSKLASGALWEGNLSGSGDVVIEGKVQGTLAVDGLVLVSGGGEVQGRVEARVVKVAGKVVGNLIASDLVELATTAVLEGDIQATRVVIAEGAYFTGKVAMAAPMAAQSAASSAGAAGKHSAKKS